MQETTNEIEILDLAPTITKIKDAFSTSSDSFARRLKDSLISLEGKLTENIQEYKGIREERGLGSSQAFEEYSEELRDIINDSKAGKSVDQRVDLVEKLKKDQIVLEELASNDDSSFDFNELDVLKDVMGELIKEINPRNLSTRIGQTVVESGKEFASGLGGEIVGAVGDLQSNIIGLADEFPPVQFALEKTNQFLNFIIGKLFSSLKAGFTRRREAKVEADAIRQKARAQKVTKEAPKTEKVKPSRVKRNKATKVQATEMLERSEITVVDITNKSINKLSKEIAKKLNKKDSDSNPVQNALLTAGALRATRTGRRNKPKAGPGLLARILPMLGIIVTVAASAFGIITTLLGSAVGLLTSLVSALLGGRLFKMLVGLGSKIFKLGPKIVTGIGAKLGALSAIFKTGLSALATKLPASIKGLFGKGPGAAAKAASVGTKAAAAGGAAATLGKVAKGGTKLLSVVGRVASKALIPLTIAGSIGTAAYRGYKAYQAGGDAGEVAAAAGKGALSFATAGASDLVFDGDDVSEVNKNDKKIKDEREAKIIRLQRQKEVFGEIKPLKRTKRIEGINSDKRVQIDSVDDLSINYNNLSQPIMSSNKMEDINRMDSAINNRRDQVIKNAGANNLSSKTMINNNNVTNSTYINRVTPENHETSYIEKTREGFAA